MAQQTISYSIRELVGPVAGHGEAVRDLLLAHLAQGETVTLDFAGLRVVFPRFMHTAIGELLKVYDPPTVREQVRLLNLPPAMNANLKRYIEDAHRYYHDPVYREAVNNIRFYKMSEGGYGMDDDDAD